MLHNFSDVIKNHNHTITTVTNVTVGYVKQNKI